MLTRLSNFTKFYSKKLVWRLIISYTAILLSCMIIVTLVISNYISNQWEQNTVDSYTTLLPSVAKEIDSFFVEISESIFPIGIDYTAITDSIKNESTDYLAQKELLNYLTLLYQSRRDISAVCLYIIHNDKYYVLSKTGNRLNHFSDYDPSLSQRPWFQSLDSYQINYSHLPLTAETVTGYPIENRDNFLMFTHGLIDIPSRENVASVSLFFNTEFFHTIIQNMTSDYTYPFILLDSQSNLIYATPNATEFTNTLSSFQLQQPYYRFKNGPEHYLVFSETTPENEYQLLLFYPKTQISFITRTMIFYICIFSVFATIAGIFVIVLVARQITHPIKQLDYHMKKFGEGSLTERAAVVGHDEVASLTEQFNLMATNISGLIQKNYQLELLNKSATLKALQAELNPHFLYNTLQSIATFSLTAKGTEIYTALLKLSNIFRYCITDATVVSLKEELNYVENYLFIQKLRFGQQLLVKYEVSEDCYPYLLPKLSIQLLVENCLKYALPAKGILIIIIRIYSDAESIYIQVTDTGKGISPEELSRIHKIFEENTQTDSIGLKNLYNRLKFLLGEQSKMTIQSDRTGTTVTLKIPPVTTMR